MSLSRPNRYLVFAWNFLFSCWFLALPLIYSYRFYNPYELPKFLWFVVGVWLLGVGKLCRGRAMVWDRLTIFILLYLLISFVSDLLGLDPRTSILGSYWRHQGWLTLAGGVLLFLLLEKRQTGLLPNTILASTFLVSAFTCWQGARFYLLKDPAVPNYNGRIVGTMGNPNFLGGWLAMVLPLAMGEMEKLKLKQKSIINFLLLALSLTAIFLSGSRGAWLAVGIVGVLWLLVRRKFKILVILLVSFSSFLLVFLHLRGVRVFIPWVSRDSIWENRLIIWQEGIKAAAKQPIFGYGQENFELIFPADRRLPVDNAHNLFLEIFLSSGIIGLLIYLAILLEAFKKVSLAVRLSLLVFLVRAQFNPLSISEIALFWYLLALEK